MNSSQSIFRKVFQVIIGIAFLIVGYFYMLYTGFSVEGFVTVFFGTGFGANLIIGGFEDRPAPSLIAISSAILTGVLLGIYLNL